MSQDGVLENLKVIHSNFCDELHREDEKSERLFTLITSLLAASILASVYFYDAETGLTKQSVMFFALASFVFFLLVSLVLSASSLFDIVYYKPCVAAPFKTVVKLIGILLGKTENKSKEENNMSELRKKNIGTLLEFNITDLNLDLKNHLETDIKWKRYLIDIKWRVRKWAIIFLYFALISIGMIWAFSFFILPIHSLILSIIILLLIVLLLPKQ